MSGETVLSDDEIDKIVEKEAEAIVKENALMLAMVAKLSDIAEFDRVLAEVNPV